VTFTEDATLEVFDTSDPDWTLVGVNDEYGFAPANYIELQEASPDKVPVATSKKVAPEVPVASDSAASPAFSSPTTSTQGPAAALAKVLGGGTPMSPIAGRSIASPAAPRQQFTPEASEDEVEEAAPALPQRPLSQSLSPSIAQHTSPRDDGPPGVLSSPPYNRVLSPHMDDDAPVQSPGGYHLYNINEMVSSLGKRKKMPTTLGLNLATGTIMLSPAKSRDGPSQEWTAEKMTHYSIEGKHVFIELIRPSKSLDLHAGAKDTAQEIVSALGEIAGAVRGEGIKEVLRAASGSGGQKKGQILHDFMAQSDDEVTVAIGDEVIVLDDHASEEWWRVRRVKNGKEGVVPSSYVEVSSIIASEPPSRSGINAGRSTVEQNRLEEERMAKEAARSSRPRGDSASETKGVEVGPGMKLPQRGSSLGGDDENRHSSQRERRSSRAGGKSSKPKPDPKKVRTWTDRSGTFRVEAQFIGLTDGKIHLHKQNGIKIAVPTSKMAVEDLEYVEKATGVSLDDDKPLENIRRKLPRESEQPRSAKSGVVEQPKLPEYDWFDFFLKAGVGPQLCERYAQAMNREAMEENILPEVGQETLRKLGLKEGDILKVMKFLDNKYGRNSKLRNEEANGDVAKTNGSAGGLFSGPDGSLQNNTRRGRPEANRQASDVVDAKVFEPKDERERAPPAESRATPLTTAPPREKVQSGFDDDAWEVKPSKQAAPTSQLPPTATPSSQPPLSGALADLSLLSPPLQPTIAPPQPAPQQAQPQVSPPPIVQPAPPAGPSVQKPQPAGANPGFFSQLNPQQTGLQHPSSGFQQPQHSQAQVNGFQQMSQFNTPRQRPQPPQQIFGPGSLLPPPPRPLSAPQNVQQQSQFGLLPLQPQLTGIPQTSPLQAPPGQSLNNLNQQRFHQQFGQPQLQQQPTGFVQPGQGQFGNGFQPKQTGFQQQQPQFMNFQSQQQPFINGNAQGSPFADPRPSYQSSLAPQQTGYGSYSQQGPPPGGINSVLPPALQPQPTGFAQQPSQPSNFQQPQQAGYQQPQQVSYQQHQQTGFGQSPQQNGFNSQNFQPPSVPPMPQLPTIAPLQPQKTGPAPPVRFGVEAKKLTPQPTGRRANLSHASEFPLDHLSELVLTHVT
jgi:actin cytoskeleton-regulatory complex protein SLA1